MKNWTSAKVEEVAKDLYGLDVSATHLEGYEDLNFRLDTERKKDRYLVFKVISDSTSIPEIECQHAALTHLKKKLGSKFRGPVPFESKNGNKIESVAGQKLRVLNFTEGTILSDLKNPSLSLYGLLGSSLGRIDKALLDFNHHSLNRDIDWDLINFPKKRDNLKYVTDLNIKDSIRFFADLFDTFVDDVHSSLRRSAIHNDVNDANVVLGGHPILPSKIQGIIDYGDLIHQSLVFDPAIALAYAIMDSDEPLTVAENFIQGYVKECPLDETELEQLYLLVGSRLSHSLLISAEKRNTDPDNEYFQSSDKQAGAAILKWRSLPERLVTHVLKQAAGVPFLREVPEIEKWIKDNSDKFDPVMFERDELDSFMISDFSVSSSTNVGLDAGPEKEPRGRSLGRYLEPRLVYRGDQFQDQSEKRTIHLGIDIFSPKGTEVFAPLKGIIYSAADNSAEFDYGPTVILEHETDAGQKFWTLYGHLDRLSLKRFKVGQKVSKGAHIGNLGSRAVNGNWPPHLHFQLITDILGSYNNFPGVASVRNLEVWKKISPNPAPLLGIESNGIAFELESNQSLLSKRKKNLSSSLSVSYSDPLKIVMGSGARLYSETGGEYLDCVNNVCHVGHSNPNVVRALRSQAALLNTNTRYLHDNIVELSTRLTSTLPKKLEVCFFVNSGSEANDLALRLAQAHTGKTDFVAIDSGYHGHTSSLIEVSPYKFNGKGGSGPSMSTKVIPMPDTYRGIYREDHDNPGQAYADHVDLALKEIESGKRGLAGFIGETILSCGGQIDPPEGFLKSVYEKIRKAGGVCIADEVQTGFGRIGSKFWAFESQGVVPDIVTMGKPMGNGHPIAAVVTTNEIAKSFANGMEYFNTFGGNPVSCAVALSVLDFIESENLQANALKVGKYFRSKLEELQKEVEYIGDVRGQGLFLGIELVKDKKSRKPDPKFAKMIVEEMKRRKILLSTDGPAENVIKIKPPLVFSMEDVDQVIRNLKFVFNLEYESTNEVDSTIGGEVYHELEEADEKQLEEATPNNDEEKPDSNGVSDSPKKNAGRDSWYGEFKADVVGYDTKVKRYGKKKRRSKKDKGLIGKLKGVLGKDSK